MQKKRILVFGANGMLGSAIYNYMALKGEFEILGTHRPGSRTSGLVENNSSSLIQCDFVENAKNAVNLINQMKPTVVINCVGVIKQRSDASEVLVTVPINTILPQLLYAASLEVGSKFIHFSTDCVFSGLNGNYSENEKPDAVDVYGLSKYLGEVSGNGALTLRTSIIGHELFFKKSLLEWFLSQDSHVMGFTNAYFSGLTTNEVARVTSDIIRDHPRLSGLYHLAAERISKFDLLTMIKKVYEIHINIVPDGQLEIDRSLIADKLLTEIGYTPRAWEVLIPEMKDFKNECDRYFQR
jgi:dTDP-4-dehydrorhamnose reductase